MKAGETLKSSYTRVFWGLILVYFDINLGFFDILPNFIGYYLISSGLGGLAQKNPAYKTGRIPSALMIFVSLMWLLAPKNTYSKDISPSSLWLFAVSGLFAIINLIIQYSVCKGVYAEAEFYENTELMKKAKLRWQALFCVTAASLVLYPFLLTGQEWVTALLFGVFIIGLICELFVAGLLRTAREALVRDIDVNT
ncbi:MAG TPA: hypothetical protein VHP38_02480 [Ruminiclostridium sp.]|nr:hypothetical protein [Ruminiclostridium sp.]